MAKTLWLIRGKYDGGKSDEIAGLLTGNGMAFTERTLGVDVLPWSVPTAPCVVIDINGSIHKLHVHIPLEREYSHAALVADWGAAPTALTGSLSAELLTKKWDGAQWVIEPTEFTEGETIRVQATIKAPDGSTYTGPGSNQRFLVPLFKGVQSAPAPDGAQIVTATDEQVAILPLQFASGVAVYDFLAAKPMWICAVPGKTSAWLTSTVSRVIVTKPVA